MMGRMSSPYGRSAAVAVFVFVLTFSPYAHAADTSAFGINDPFADAIQLWSALFSSIDSLAHQIASALQLHQTLTFSRTANPHAPKNLQQPVALAASAALATQSPSESATTSGSASDAAITPQQPQTTNPPEATSDQTTQSPFVKQAEFSPKSPNFFPPSSATPQSAFVTQAQFNAAMSALGASVQQLLAKTNTNPLPEFVGGDGNNLNPYAAASAINNLSGVTIANPTISGLSAGDIPDLSGSYLSLNGGTLTGAFVDSATASSSFAGALGIGTTSPSDVLAVNGPIFLGSVSPAATADRLYNNGGSLYWAGSPIAGGSVGNWTTDGTNVWRTGGNVGIGTTTPGSLLSVQGVANFTTATSTFYSSGGLNLTGGGCFAIKGTCITGSGGINGLTAYASSTIGNGSLTGGLTINGGATTTGNVYVGPTSAQANPEGAPNFGIVQSGTDIFSVQGNSSYSDVQVAAYRNTSGTHALLEGLGARGTGSSPAAIQTGDDLLSIRAGGYGTTNFDSYVKDDAAAIEFQADQPFSDSGGVPQHGGRIVFETANGSSYDLERMRITSLGLVGVGTTSPYAQLSVVGASAATTTFNITGASGQTADLFDVNNGEGLVDVIKSSGNIGIGTTTPYSHLTLWGPDTSGGTSAFVIANSASTTEFNVLDNGNATLAGTLTQNSDQRLKTNIQSLDASSSLAAIDALNPVTFNWLDLSQGSTTQLGFIAQQVEQIFPNLVATTSPTALTPDGTLSLNYIGLISPIVSAIQALSAELSSIENTIAGFAENFASNHITASQQLCVGSTCVTPAQFQAIVAAANLSSSSQTPAPTNDATDTPPVIQINGDNPAIVQVGASYNDLGATITGPQADLNLGITTYLNGSPMNPVQLDTTEAATDTIAYVATDQNGLTSTSTRTLIIEIEQSASTTAAASTSTTQ